MREVSDPLIICNQKHRSLVKEQLSDIDIKPSAVLLEPFGRNTAPAIAISAMQAVAKMADPVLLVMPSDHIIADKEAFRKAANMAKKYAVKSNLVTFGITPSRPETGYGYIEAGQALDGMRAYKIAKFIEKPDFGRAKTYLEAGNYYWNSGMFMFRASVFLQELQYHAPEIFSACEKIVNHISSNADFLSIPEKEFSLCPGNSIDYAVMEKTKKGVMISLNAGWSDIGSWKSLWEYGKKDNNGNVIFASSRKVVSLGIKDCIIIATGKEVLLVHKDHCQNAKN